MISALEKIDYVRHFIARLVKLALAFVYVGWIAIIY